jgi:hypothetical protein
LGDFLGPNPTDRGKNRVKHYLLVEADGGPLSIIIAGANVRDDKPLAATTLEAVVLERPEATEETPQRLCLEKGYDNRPSREVVEGRSYVPTSDASARRRSTWRARNGFRPGVGSWSERWAGSRSVGRSSCAMRRRPQTTWGWSS